MLIPAEKKEKKYKMCALLIAFGIGWPVSTAGAISVWAEETHSGISYTPTPSSRICPALHTRQEMPGSEGKCWLSLTGTH